MVSTNSIFVFRSNFERSTARFNLDCCVVRDLLPSYLEELTETETSAMVREHIEHCAACRQLEEDMRRQVPIEKAPQRALRFLKRVKRTRLIAASLI